MPNPSNQQPRPAGSGASPTLFNAAEMLRDMKKQYGADGAGMNFGAVLVSLCRDASDKLPKDLELTVPQF